MGWIRDLFKAKVQNFGSTIVHEPTESFQYYGYESNESYISKLGKIYRGYNDALKYGSSGIQTVINYRRSWVMGSNPTIQGDSNFVDWLYKSTNFKTILGRLSTVSEMEGKWAVLIKPSTKDGSSSISFKLLRWYDYQYEIDFNEFDEPVKLYYKNKIGKEVSFSENQFVFCNSSTTETARGEEMYTVPNVMGVLKQLETMDKSLANWRDINKYVANNTIFFETKDFADAARLAKIMKGKTENPQIGSDLEDGKKWKLGEGLVAPAKPTVISISRENLDSLKDEFVTNAQYASGHTGIPIYLFGFPEMLSNRATAEEIAEGIINKTSTERERNKDGLETLLKKTAIMSNQFFGTAYGVDYQVTIPPTSLAEKKAMYEMFLPLFDKGIISKNTIRAMLPDVNPEQEEAEEMKNEEKLQERVSLAMSSRLPMNDEEEA